MNASPSTTHTPSQRAEQAIRAVLSTQWDGAPAVRLDSPPGAGKTGIVERVAAQSLALLHERCMIATSTNEQSFDLVRRLASGFSRLTFMLWVSKELEVPSDVRALGNVQIASSADELPHGPCVVVANAAKWSWIQGSVEPFDVLIVDEAFQLADYRFQLIAGLARRFVLVGDPGQIAPVITAPIERWRCDPAGPHIACPEAFVARHASSVVRLSLPVSRRLVADTVRVIQPAFYRQLPFEALAEEGERSLLVDAATGHSFDGAIARAARGSSLVLDELPEKLTTELDEAIAERIVSAIHRLLERRARVRDGQREHTLTAERIGVTCAHVVQVNAVRERLPADLRGVLVETAERFQGLERDVMFVHHPLSGRAELGAFALDAGRACVMTTRHRVACFIVARAGILARLERQAPTTERVLGLDRDREWEGYRAHRAVLRALADRATS
jgi:hypothetical protein